MDKAKPFDIPKRMLWEAYKKVKANGGSAGVDDESIEDFDSNLKNNLYKLWNRMSSGTYFPPPVKSGSDTKKRWWRASPGSSDSSRSNRANSCQRPL
jgi:RNA-directed DNA polymerase